MIKSRIVCKSIDEQSKLKILDLFVKFEARLIKESINNWDEKSRKINIK